MASIATATRYVKLAKKKDELEDKLKAVKASMKDVEVDLLEYFQAHGLQNLRAGDRTVAVRKEIWASLKDQESGVAAFRAAGLGDLVNEAVNSQRLSAWVRELLDKLEGDLDRTPDSEADIVSSLPVPQEVRDAIKVSERLSLRVTK